MSILDSTERNIYHYVDGQWELHNYKFPVTMDSHEKMLEYLHLNQKADDRDLPLGIEVYYGEYDRGIESYMYGVIITFWEDHGPLVICPKYIDLLKLFNELNGYMNIVKDVSVYNIELNTKSTIEKLEDVSNELDNLDTRMNEIRLETERVGNLIEYDGISNKIKKYIDEAVKNLKPYNKTTSSK